MPTYYVGRELEMPPSFAVDDSVNSRYRHAKTPRQFVLRRSFGCPYFTNLADIIFCQLLRMIRLVFTVPDNHQVQRIIVEPVAINMMNVLGWLQRVSQFLLCNIPMFKNTSAARDIDAPTLGANAILRSLAIRDIRCNFLPPLWGEVIPKLAACLGHLVPLRLGLWNSSDMISGATDCDAELPHPFCKRATGDTQAVCNFLKGTGWILFAQPVRIVQFARHLFSHGHYYSINLIGCQP